MLITDSNNHKEVIEPRGLAKSILMST